MVMFEPQRDFPRAYVALPVLPEDAVLLALKWALDHSETRAWESIGLRVPQRGYIRDVPVLLELEKRGVRISVDRHTSSNQSPRGPLMVYCPNVESLVAAEDLRGASAIVAISANNEWLRPWVDAYHPEHLGGDVVHPAAPTVREPVVWEALTDFTPGLLRMLRRPGYTGPSPVRPSQSCPRRGAQRWACPADPPQGIPRVRDTSRAPGWAGGAVPGPHTPRVRPACRASSQASP